MNNKKITKGLNRKRQIMKFQHLMKVKGNTSFELEIKNFFLFSFMLHCSKRKSQFFIFKEREKCKQNYVI